MTIAKSVYVAWQSPETRSWHVVGNLQERSNGYVFKYTKGSCVSDKFTKFSGMEDINKTYVSEELFPLFKNRLLSPKRPEYPRFMNWLGLSDEEQNPIEILARSGGSRSTDQLQMFKKFDVSENGELIHYFFLHGLSYLNEQANQTVSNLKVGDALQLCLDVQNEHDDKAVFARASDPAEIVGYCPRYFSADIKSMLIENPCSVKLVVEKISDDAPTNYRLLCKFYGKISPSMISKLPKAEEFEAINK